MLSEKNESVSKLFKFLYIVTVDYEAGGFARIIEMTCFGLSVGRSKLLVIQYINETFVMHGSALSSFHREEL